MIAADRGSVVTTEIENCVGLEGGGGLITNPGAGFLNDRTHGYVGIKGKYIHDDAFILCPLFFTL